jgi:hypothetical protein
LTKVGVRVPHQCHSVQQVRRHQPREPKSAQKFGIPRTSRPSSPGPVRRTRTLARGGLFALFIAVKELDDGVQVMRVHRLDELIDHLGHPEST